MVITVHLHLPEATQVITLEEYMESGEVDLLDRAIKTVILSLTGIQVGLSGSMLQWILSGLIDHISTCLL